MSRMHESNTQPTEHDVKKLLFPIFDKLSRRENLTVSEAELTAKTILDGLANNWSDICELLIAFFGGLTIKDPTLDELTGMAAAMEATKQFRFRFNANKPLVTAKNRKELKFG